MHIFFADTEVLAGGSKEGLFITDYFAVERVDYGIRLVTEAVDTADLLEMRLPLAGVLDDDAEVDIGILCLDSIGDLLTICCVDVVRGACDYVTAHPWISERVYNLASQEEAIR